MRRLRRALPWTTALLAALVIGWIAVRSAVSLLAPNQTGFEIRVSRPRFYGRDERRRPYLIAALRAVRDSGDPDLVTLAEPDMTLTMNGPKPAHLRARTGVYNQASHVLAVEGDVVFEDGSGYVFHSRTARIDTLTHEVEGRDSVTGDGPMGRTLAQSYFVHDKGAQVVFAGGVRSHLNNDRTGSSAVK